MLDQMNNLLALTVSCAYIDGMSLSTKQAHVGIHVADKSPWESPPSHPMSLGGEVWVGEVQLTVTALEAVAPRLDQKPRNK